MKNEQTNNKITKLFEAEFSKKKYTESQREDALNPKDKEVRFIAAFKKGMVEACYRPDGMQRTAKGWKPSDKKGFGIEYHLAFFEGGAANSTVMKVEKHYKNRATAADVERDFNKVLRSFESLR